MQNIFLSTGFLDKSALDYGLTEDILMENAAAALESKISTTLKKRGTFAQAALQPRRSLTILIVCGSGNNGGDGYTLARRIQGKIVNFNYTDTTNKSDYSKKESSLCVTATVYEAKTPKTPACILQAKRATNCGVPVICGLEQLEPVLQTCAVIVDCLFGSGFSGTPNDKSQKLISLLNGAREYNPSCFFLSCDMPSGLTSYGEATGAIFEADETVTMGTYKIALFSDEAKDYTGSISVADLGISRTQLEKAGTKDIHKNERIFLLEKSDMRLPVRAKQNVHKGTFGHAAVVSGEKIGAAQLACQAAFVLGAGLVTAILTTPAYFPAEIMQTDSLPTAETALCAGMGLGRTNPAAEKIMDYIAKNPSLPCVIDADLLHHPALPLLLAKRGNLVLTPHPKEFAELLRLCGLGTFTVPQIAVQRFNLAASFCARFPAVTLLLKGANTLICADGNRYINTFGSNNLAKGGSGDMLAGFIVSLLAQGYSPKDAAINASLIHGLAAQKTGVTYSLTPTDLFRAVKELENDI